MDYKSTQKVIQIGSSIGVTIPAREARQLGIKPGDKVTLSLGKKDRMPFLKIAKAPFALLLFRRP